MATAGSGNTNPPESDSLSGIEGALSEPPERPTRARLRRIEQSGEPTQYPTPFPASAGKYWSPAGVVMVIGAAGTFVTVAALAVKPLIEASKPDLSAYVRKADYDREKAEIEDQLARARRKAADAWQVCEDLRGQFSGLDDRQESLEKQKKRR